MARRFISGGAEDKENVVCEGEMVRLSKQYIDHLKDLKRSLNTLTSRRYHLRHFVAHLQANDIDRFQEVTGRDIEDYRLNLIEAGYAEGTIAGRLETVRQLYRYLADQAWIFDDPTAELIVPKAKAKLPRILTVAQIRTLLAAPDLTTPHGLRDRAMLEMLYSSGLRRAELQQLRTFDIDIKNATVRVVGKGRKTRTVPLGEHAVQALSRYLLNARDRLADHASQPTDALWITRFGTAQSHQMIAIMVRKYAKRAGLRRLVCPHDLRRSCATHMLHNGAHPVIVAELLGHANLGSLSHYLRVSITDLYKTHRNSKPGR